MKTTTGAEAQAKAYIYFKESTNRTDAVNQSSGACGIGQSLPCSKMASECPNWQNDYGCQDKWFTKYMKSRYGSWAAAMQWHKTHNWW